jgi:ABC-type sugar transport system ATPase subunit
MPLELRRDPVEEIRKRVGAEARALHIEQLLGASPRTLSAGEAQAVQIARAMVKRPSVLLLDEPFARVDLDLAAVLRRELLLIQRGFGVTTLLVTNDPEDAMSMPSSLVALERGAVVQVATPTEMYERPRTLGAALSTGDTNALTVHVEHDGHGAWLTHEAFRIRDWRPALRATGRRFQLLVRPSWWRLDPHGVPSATVERTSTLPGLPSTVRLGADLVRAFLPGVRIGETVSLRPDRWVLIDPRTGYCVDG